jgi:hypothetical protein
MPGIAGRLSRYPDLALLERSHGDLGNDAEVVGSSTQSTPEVRVGLRICIHDLARGENDFEVFDVVTDEAIPR